MGYVAEFKLRYWQHFFFRYSFFFLATILALIDYSCPYAYI